MENTEQPKEAMTEAEFNASAEATANTNRMLVIWAQKQAAAILQKMERSRAAHTLSLHWPKVKQGWNGGFVSGVTAGFQLGYQAANKLNQNFLDKTDAVLAGTEAETIKARNNEIRRILCEAVGEASMCWSETPKGVFDSARAEGIANQLFSRFATPLPEPAQAQLEAVGQTRLPGV